MGDIVGDNESEQVLDEAMKLIKKSIENRTKVDNMVDEMDIFNDLAKHDSHKYQYFVRRVLEASKQQHEVKCLMSTYLMVEDKHGETKDELWLKEGIDIATLRTLLKENPCFQTFRSLDMKRVEEDWKNFKDSCHPKR